MCVYIYNTHMYLILPAMTERVGTHVCECMHAGKAVSDKTGTSFLGYLLVG